MSRKQKVGKAESREQSAEMFRLYSLTKGQIIFAFWTNTFCNVNKYILYFCQQLEGWSASYSAVLFCKRNVKFLTTTKKVTTTRKSMHFCSMSQSPCIDPVLQLIILIEATVHCLCHKWLCFCSQVTKPRHRPV